MVVVQKKMNPDYRSSALFSIYINKDLENDIAFLNYWKKKNDLSNVKFISSLWNSDGVILGKKIKEIYLEEHFGPYIGWCFSNTDNNFYNSWYFSVGKENIEGGHCF